MKDEEVIRRGIYEAKRKGFIIDDLTARVIGNWYHAGQASVSYAFASTGAILFPRELWRELFINHGDMDTKHYDEAYHLAAYLLYHGKRGPQPGWSDLHW